MKKYLKLVVLFCCLGSLTTSSALAQKVDTKMMQKARWFNANREYQIIDERPTVRDFREAPEAGQQIELPPGPKGAGGGYGGPGSGAMDNLPPSTDPVQLGGSNPGYRSQPAGLGSLPKSGFGRESNIPARGLAPKGLLPGVTTGVLGKLMTPPKGGAAGAPKGLASNRARSMGSSPALQSYSGGYGQGGTGSGGSSSRTETMVRGSLLRSK